MLPKNSRNKTADQKLFLKHPKIPHQSQIQQKYKQLYQQLTLQKIQHQQCKTLLKQAQRSLVLKSIQYQQQINSLKSYLRQIRQGGQPQVVLMQASVSKIDQVYNQLLQGVSQFKQQYHKQFQSQQKEYIRLFDAKLTQICNKLQNKRQQQIKSNNQAQKAQSRMTKQLQILKQSAATIKSKNQQLERENKYLKGQLQSREKEFNSLMAKYFRIKRRAREFSPRPDESVFTPRALSTPRRVSRYQISSSPEKSYEYTQRYESVISKLRKQLDLERKNLRAARTAYSREISSKTDIEKLLRACVEDIRAEINRKKGYRKRESEEERKVIIERLLQTEEILRSLYDRTFPMYDGLSRGIIK